VSALPGQRRPAGRRAAPRRGDALSAGAPGGRDHRRGAGRPPVGRPGRGGEPAPYAEGPAGGGAVSAMPAPLPPFRWPWDLIDILVVTLIVFQILMLVRRTRAVQLVAGLGVLFAAYLISQTLQLYTLQWVLRSVGLADFIETGIRIDAVATVQLLINIFFPNTPLHDGALIIRGDRLVAAGCLLPLTERPGLSRALGTRHRAAIGITEETDAVAVVVSEETGTISLAREGRLTRGLTEEELKGTLLALSCPQPRPRASFSVPSFRVPMPVRVPGLWQWARRRGE